MRLTLQISERGRANSFGSLEYEEKGMHTFEKILNAFFELMQHSFRDLLGDLLRLFPEELCVLKNSDHRISVNPGVNMK